MSRAASLQGLSSELIATMLDTLMQSLGYEHYVVQGGMLSSMSGRLVVSLVGRDCVDEKRVENDCFPPTF